MFYPLLERTPQNFGALDDTRSEEERAKDFQFSEIVATADPVDWKEKSTDQWRKFPIMSQDGSGSCVAQSGAKMVAVLQYLRDGEYIPLSASYLYQRRANKNIGDGQGMQGIDALEILRNDGITLEALMPSQNLSETAINQVPEKPYYKKVADIFRIDNYVVYRPRLDFDSIASTIQKTGKAVMVWFRFDIKEWTDEPRVLVTSPSLHHSVLATDVALYKGQQGLVIDDSWGASRAINGQRFITREFFEARNTFAAYPISFRTTDSLPQPKHVWLRDLEYGAQNDTDVKKLQDVLKFEKLFPTNVESTGYYGEITRRAVLAFQMNHKVASLAELQSVNGKRVGTATRAELNRLYGA